MSLLYNRRIVVNIGGLQITNLRMSFNIVKTADSKADALELQIYNLSPENRKRIQERDTLIELSAGYVENIELIFKGKIDFASNVRDSVDVVSTVQVKDGGLELASARLNRSFAKGTKITEIIKEALKELGLGTKDAFQKITSGNFREGVTELLTGGVATGSASKKLDEYLKSYGKEWTVQDEQVVIVDEGKVSEQLAVVLSPSSGLIGSPEIGEDGIIRCKSLLQPGLKPFRSVRIKSGEIDGFFRVEKVTHTGDNYDTPWYSEIEAKVL